jgi:formamidopyrimidine-DNA glycosylase
VPELPEVETIRRVLQDVLPGHGVIDAYCSKPKMLRGQDPRVFESGLEGRRCESVDRRGKFLLIRLDLKTLLVHLGMTGQIFACSDDGGACVPKPRPGLPDKHTHLQIKLTQGMRLYFRDVRMFGRYALIDREEELSLFRRLGPEPLGGGFTSRDFFERVHKRHTTIKAVLLDQRAVAGVGNIYADESLFRAGIRPETRAGDLTREQARRLHRSLRRVLREAVYSGGTTLSDYLDPRDRRGTFQWKLHVYGRQGEKCFRCGEPIQRSVVAQRGTHFCPSCQV